jgi:hypothetical protein
MRPLSSPAQQVLVPVEQSIGILKVERAIFGIASNTTDAGTKDLPWLAPGPRWSNQSGLYQRPLSPAKER